MKKPANLDEPEKAIPQVKNEDSQPITAAAWKANEPELAPAPTPAETAPPKRDHHAKEKHDAAAKPAPKKAEA